MVLAALAAADQAAAEVAVAGRYKGIPQARLMLLRFKINLKIGSETKGKIYFYFCRANQFHEVFAS